MPQIEIAAGPSARSPPLMVASFENSSPFASTVTPRLTFVPGARQTDSPGPTIRRPV